MAKFDARDAVVAGPAAGRPVASPNRLGSHEVPVRIYEPRGVEPWATVVWAHGGSFVRGTLDWPEAHWISSRLAEAGLRVCSVDYALASEEVKAPAPANDVASVLRWALAEHRDTPVLIGGASAGGHLATVAALQAVEDWPASQAPEALLLIYPTLHREQRPAPRLAAFTARLPEVRRFGPERIAEMYDFYLGDAASRPGSAVPVGELPPERLAQLPPTVIVNADIDDLRTSGEQFAQQLREAGVPVVQTMQPGTIHGYMNRPEQSAGSLRDARATIDVIVRRARAILDLDAEPGTSATEPAIAAPTELTLPDGRLNPAAVGWASQPIIDTSGLGAGRGRNKRWEYWNVCTPDHILALTVSHIDYACVPEVWLYERATGRTRSRAVTVIPSRGTVLAPSLEQGRSMARAKNLAIDIDEVSGGTRLRGQIEGVAFDLIAELPPGHERLALVVPWSETRFQYTVKDLARPVTGAITVDGERRELPEGDSWAVLDHGRGRWPYRASWNWGAASGRSGGRVIGLQLGARWTEGTGVSENAVFIDGRMHKMHGDTHWQYDLDDWRSPWRVVGGGLEAVFEPFCNKVTRTDLLVLRGHTDQCFGVWSGSFETADGERIEFDGLTGWAEEVSNRW